jgi:multidrug efflux system outer membrane protein
MIPDAAILLPLIGRARRECREVAVCLALGMLFSLNGCTLAPEYTRPTAPIQAEWPAGAAYEEGQASPDAPVAPDLSWREFFTDEKLRQVIEMALTNNRDLRLAALNVEFARAQYGIQRAELFPSLYATGSGNKQHSSADLTQPGQPRTAERYDVDLGVLSWEIDFFGRIRSLKDSALEEYLATEEARRSTQVLLISAVADAYLALAADREQLDLALATLRTQEAAYQLVRRQLELGVANGLDLEQARAPVEVARRAIASYTQRIAQDKNALNLLAGATVPGEFLPAKLADVSSPREISPGLPSDVLLGRPDVLQAEARLKAANADIGAARAAFFPRISLTTILGTASDELSGLFQSGSGTWSYGTQVVMPIFDARTWSALDATKAQREIVLTQYEKAIQSAFREVADALAVRGTVNQQVAAQEALVDALAEAHRLSGVRFEGGTDSYLGVLFAQRSLFDAQQILVSLRTAQFLSQVRLYAVLGGGADSPNQAAPK